MVQMWLTYLLFYLGCFVISFFLCIPIGPVNLQVFQRAVKKEYGSALSLAFGAAIGDSLWAMAAFFGITPFLKNGYNLNLEGIFLLVTAVITLVLGFLALKDARFLERIEVLEKREEAIAARIQRKRWAFLQGLVMVLVNPLGIASWMIALSFLKKLKIYIPLTLNHEIAFMVVVVMGAFAYFTLIVVITNRMKSLCLPSNMRRVIRVLGYVLIGFGLYFLFFAVKALFFTAAPK
jgi:threonine/homoserine/homoserine lactone efflux protein